MPQPGTKSAPGHKKVPPPPDQSSGAPFCAPVGAGLVPSVVLDSVVWFEFSELVLLWDPISALWELSSIPLTHDGWGVDI